MPLSAKGQKLKATLKGTFKGIDSANQVVPTAKGSDERDYTVGQFKDFLTKDKAAGFPKLKAALGRMVSK